MGGGRRGGWVVSHDGARWYQLQIVVLDNHTNDQPGRRCIEVRDNARPVRRRAPGFGLAGPFFSHAALHVCAAG